MIKRTLSLIVVIGLVACSCSREKEPDIENIIREGNILSTEYVPDEETGCYLANGRFGAVFNGLGLNNPPDSRSGDNAGASCFSHLKHWGRFCFTSTKTDSRTSADYLLPLFRLYWENEPDSVSGYRQEQDFYDGVLRTFFTDGDGIKVSMESWFDMDDKDLAGFRIRLEGGNRAIRLLTETDFEAYPYVFQGKVTQSTFVEKYADSYKVSICCGQATNNNTATLYVYCSSPVEVCDDGLRMMLGEGDNEVFISYGHPSEQESRDNSQAETVSMWHNLWQNTGWMLFPDSIAQAMWVRSSAYLLESFADTDLPIIPPVSGLSGNPFPFNFVQDLEYVAPSLMMTGHRDIVEKWVEKFAGLEDDMRTYSQKLWPGSDGIYPPWELPFGPIAGYHEPEVPVVFCYEPHNVGYLARMAYEAAEFAGDKEWADTYAAALVSGCARFYESASHKEEDGRWHLGWTPCVGQDEAGGRNLPDCFCSLCSARYSFEAAVGMGLDHNGRFRTILNEGLAFDNLVGDDGILHTSPGADEIGRQKHPVQLDGITYFPRDGGATEAERKAYAMRHSLTAGADEPHFDGWTLGQLLLAGSNLGDTEGWKEDWGLLLPSEYCDEKFIQIYESSGKTDFPFYITTSGMILQSMIRNYVNDYWGELDIAGCNIFQEKTVHFGNIITKFGVTVSGSVTGKTANVVLKADRATKFKMNGSELSLNPGDTRKLTLKLD